MQVALVTEFAKLGLTAWLHDEVRVNIMNRDALACVNPSIAYSLRSAAMLLAPGTNSATDLFL